MPKRGEPATEAQRAALKRGQAARTKALKSGKKERAHERWGMLLSGQITVKDLDDEELKRMRVRGKGGTFSGRARIIPSHIAQAMAAERMERWKNDVMAGVPDAIAALVRIANDDEHKDQAKIAQWLVERALGKTPEVVQVQTTGFDSVAAEAIGEDRTLADEAEQYLAGKAHGKDAE